MLHLKTLYSAHRLDYFRHHALMLSVFTDKAESDTYKRLLGWIKPKYDYNTKTLEGFIASPLNTTQKEIFPTRQEALAYFVRIEQSL